MWRHAVRVRGSSCRSVAAARRNSAGANKRLSSPHSSSTYHSSSRSLSSTAQLSSSWEEGPFAMMPQVDHIPNPTAERVVMKTFLDTLDASHTNSTAVETVSLWQRSHSVVGSVQEDEIMEEVVYEGHTVNVALSSTAAPLTDERAEQDPDETAACDAAITPDKDKKHNVIQKHALYGTLTRAIRFKDAKKTKQAYLELERNEIPIDVKDLLGVFNTIVHQDPITAYRVVQHYREVTGKPAHPAVYAILCESVGTVHWKLARQGIFTKLVLDLQRDLSELERDPYQTRCLPILLVGLVKQPMARIGRMARNVYDFIRRQNISVSHGKLCQILAANKFRRQDDLSFPSILSQLVKEGYRPYPPLAVQVLQNLFPYTNVRETTIAMKALVDLQSSWEAGLKHANYRVDVGMLENVMVGAARKGSLDLNLLVWDLMDLLGYEPVEGMYETTVQGFVMQSRQDHNVFCVLQEMEERGFTPSRALIRGLSRSIRFSSRRVDHAYRLVTSPESEDGQLSLASLNVVLSAAAELGDVDRAFATFDDFHANEIAPNADSYSFLLEALAVSVNPYRRNDEEQRLEDIPGRLDAASAILSLMEENDVKMCQHCIDNYARLLYFAGRLDAATEFLIDSLERGETVGNKIIIVMAKNNAEAGNFEVARLLASKTSETFSHLENRINVLEQGEGKQRRNAADEHEYDEDSEQQGDGGVREYDV